MFSVINCLCTSGPCGPCCPWLPFGPTLPIEPLIPVLPASPLCPTSPYRQADQIQQSVFYSLPRLHHLPCHLEVQEDQRLPTSRGYLSQAHPCMLVLTGVPGFPAGPAGPGSPLEPYRSRERY